MNTVLFYGGFFMAILCFVCAGIFFIAFKIPSVILYFRRNAKPLVQYVPAVKATTERNVANIEEWTQVLDTVYEERTTLLEENTTLLERAPAVAHPEPACEKTEVL